MAIIALKEMSLVHFGDESRRDMGEEGGNGVGMARNWTGLDFC